MKHLLFACLMLTASLVWAQPSPTEGIITDLNTLYTEQGLKSDGRYFVFDHATRMLQLGAIQIPVTYNTLVQYERERGTQFLRHYVGFFLQNGTTIIDNNDPAARHASFRIAFRNKKACSRFIELFEALKKR